MLGGEYRIDGVLGKGGFGITYSVLDIRLETRRAIKEYFPDEMSRREGPERVEPYSGIHSEQFAWGRSRFLDEGQLIAGFNDPHIVKVIRLFEQNNTAYMVLDFIEGETLESFAQRNPPLPAETLVALARRMLDTLEIIHSARILHRDISPDNIMLRKNGEPVLIDFGSARRDLSTRTKTFAIVKPGYSPVELYTPAGPLQGPWSDFYALAGTLYRLIAGGPPPLCFSRVAGEPLTPAAQIGAGRYPEALLAGIDAALSMSVRERPQTVGEWRRIMLEEHAADIGPPAANAPHPLPPAPTDRSQRADIIDSIRNAFRPHAAGDGVSTGIAPATTDAEALHREADADDAAAWAEAVAADSIAGWRAYIAGSPQGANVAEANALIGARLQNRLARTLEGPGGPVQSIAVSADGHSALAGGADGTLSSLDLVTGKVRRTVRAHRGRVWSVLILPDARFAISTGEDATAKLWEVETGTEVRTFRGHDDAVLCAAATADGLGVVTGARSRRVLLFDCNTGRVIDAYDNYNGQVWAIATSPDGRSALTGGQDQVLRLHEMPALSNGRPLARLAAGITSLAFSPDGRQAISGSQDGSVHVWDLSGPHRGSQQSLSPRHTLRGHADLVRSLVYAAGGRLIVSGSVDGTVRLWRPDTGAGVLAIAAHRERVSEVAADPLGGRVVSASADGTLKLWDVSDVA